MKIFRLTQFFALTLIVLTGAFFWQPAFATDTSGTITVSSTIPVISGTCTSGCTTGGDNFPTITNVASSTAYTTAQVTWNAADDNGIVTSSFVYGPNSAYDNSAGITGSFEVNISDLATNTLYYFKISVTDTNNQTTAYLGTFQTQAEGVLLGSVAPNIFNVQRSVGVTTTTISWQLDKTADGQILYGTTAGYGVQTNLVAPALSHSITLSGLTAGTLYHYQIVSTDQSTGLSTSTEDATFTTQSGGGQVATENCTNGIDDNSNGQIDCADSACSADPTCQVAPGVENCTNGIDDNDNGLIDCADSACSADSACQIIQSNVEICGNGTDDDNNGLTDCADPACSSLSACQTVVPPTETQYTPPAVTVSAAQRFNLEDVVFTVGGNILLAPIDGAITTLAGTNLGISVPRSKLSSAPESVILKVDGQEQGRFIYDVGKDSFINTISFPLAGTHQAYLEINYGQGQFDAVGFKMDSLPYATVTDGAALLPGATVTLLNADGSPTVTAPFGYPNPIITSNGGSYGWLVPNGTYTIKITKDGYYDRLSPPFTVTNHVANFSLALIARPLEIKIDPDQSVIANVENVAKAIGSQATAAIKRGLEVVADIRSNPAAQDTVSQVIAPALVGAAAVGTLSFISFANLLPLLRLLFLQPLLLLGRKKREGWGQVYNSLNKLPVDLATVRLIDAGTGRVVQTKVTDKKGRYAFIAAPGQYLIEAVKGEFVFPSALLKDFKEDGRRTDIYHGEPITVTEKDAVITANIPLDPAGEVIKAVRINWQRIKRKLQIFVSLLGLVFTAISLYLAPRWYVWILMGIQVALFFVFRRLAIPPKIKSWGIVYDDLTQKPVGRTIARLFNSQFNKLVSTQVTDSKGRYYFLAGDNPYYVTYEHPHYEAHKTELIDLSGKEAANIAVDVKLKQAGPSGAIPPIHVMPVEPGATITPPTPPDPLPPAPAEGSQPVAQPDSKPPAPIELPKPPTEPPPQSPII